MPQVANPPTVFWWSRAFKAWRAWENRVSWPRKCVTMRRNNAYTVEQRWSKQLLYYQVLSLKSPNKWRWQILEDYKIQYQFPRGWDIFQALELLTHFTYLFWSNTGSSFVRSKTCPQRLLRFPGISGRVCLTVKWCFFVAKLLPSSKLNNWNAWL